MNQNWQTLALAVASAAIAVSGVAVGAPLVQYTFSEGTGTTTANLGTLGPVADLTLSGGAVFSTAGNTPLGVGHALDNTATAAASPAGIGGKAQSAGDVTGLDSLPAATMTGWYKAESLGTLARLLDRADNAVGATQWSLYIDGDINRLQLNLGGTTYVSGTGYGVTDAWVFFAVVVNDFDGFSNRIRFYLGSETASVSAAGDLASSSSGLGDSDKPLTVANRFTGTRAFDGLMFDVRIYGSALSPDELEVVRLQAIPEPASAGLLAAGCGLLLRRRRG
ncbi:MAG: LamG-like jellyroll fold domain-containing protein [Tepidisphaerales bacterium]